MTSKINFDLYQPSPLLIVISGPSGVGKDSVVQRMKSRGLPFHFVVTTTTRPKRAHEIHGQDYFFVARDEFERMIKDGELLEHAMVYNDYKGVPKAQIRQAMASGKDAVMRVDVQGAATIHKIEPEAVLIFLSTKNEDELINRLKKRKTETAESLAIRMEKVQAELRCAQEFDYVVINHEGRLDETVDIVTAIIKVEHHRVNHRQVRL